MKKNINIFLIIFISILFLSGCTTNNDNKKDDETNNNDETNLRENLNTIFVEMVKEKYDSIQYENSTIIVISLEDIEKVYKLDISKFKTKELECDLKMSNVKIEVKDNKKTYTSNLNCSGLID